MVGLKTVWITILGLFLLGACVPQTKQTECRSNEAFNASLRTCVPVIGGPSSFIKVKSYSPAMPISVYKNDSQVFPLAITIDNPYGQSYSVEWERVYFGTPSFFAGNTLSSSFVPLSLASEIGAHFITAKIVASGQVVDSHTFQVTVSDTPRPKVVDSTVVPDTYAVTLTPEDAPQEFSFNVTNNNSVVSGAGYTVKWTVTKNGVNVAALAETDAFTTVTTNGTNSFNLGATGSNSFDPAALGVGNYVIKAVVGNTTPGEIVDEVRWSVTVEHPPLGNIVSVTSPTPGNTITSYHGLNYTEGAPYNFTVSGTQPQFCIELSDADGTYSGDGKGVLVKYYLNGIGGEIYTKETDDNNATEIVCLVDGTFDPTLLIFLNSSATLQQNHKITARIIDKATGQEYSAANFSPASGNYPIEWTILNKPVNAAPVIAFGSTQPTGCSNSGAYTKTNCSVEQGEFFDISFTVSDDFYTGAANPEKFLINVKMIYGTTTFVDADTKCEKAIGVAEDATHLFDYVTGALGWRCRIKVPHHFENVPVNPGLTFKVTAEVSDEDSPLSLNDPKAAFPLTWMLKVTEKNNTSPNVTLNAQTTQTDDSSITIGATAYTTVSGTVSEGNTINFNLNVTDPELDNIQYKISLCTTGGAACTQSVPITAGFETYSRISDHFPDGNNYYLIPAASYTLDQGFLMERFTPKIDVDTSTPQNVYFKVEVKDSPSIATTTVKYSDEPTRYQIWGIQVLNVNPAPVLGGTPSPLVNSPVAPYTVMTGIPITIDPGTVSDASTATSEDNIEFQWYASHDSGASYTAIPGATSKNLKWTPDSNYVGATIQLVVCIGDGTAANTTASPTASGNCSDDAGKIWYVTPVNNLVTHASTQVRDEQAIWYDSFESTANHEVMYSAFVNEDKQIVLNKTVFLKGTNSLDTSFSSITFEGLPPSPDAVETISNLSLTGTAESLYIAYLASTNSAQSSMVPRLRRIEKNYDVTLFGEKSALAHKGKFGFTYTGYEIDLSNCSACSLDAAADDSRNARIIVFSAAPAENSLITINGYTFTAVHPANAVNEVCDNTICSASGAAASLANKINSSTAFAFQGITAMHNPGDDFVTLYGQYEADYLDWDGSMTGPSNMVALAGQMGKIFISGDYWFIPVANSSLGAGDQNKISILSGKTDEPLSDGAVGLSESEILNEVGKVMAFDSSVNSDGELIIASISAQLGSLGLANIHRYTISNQDVDPAAGTQGKNNLFSSRAFESIKLATSKASNNYHYVLAKEQISSDYYIGKYHKALTTAVEYALEDRTLTTDSTETYISDTLMLNPVLVTVRGSEEARIIFSDATLNFPRIANWRSDSTISCGACLPIGGEVRSASKIAVSEVHEDFTHGTAGATAGENVKDVIYAVFASLNGAEYNPQVGIFNVESESISSTSTDDTNHLFRPPYVK